MSRGEAATGVLAISGSLKRGSTNSAVLRAAASAAARDGITVRIDDSVCRLPHFDPDVERDPPAEVLQFRAACDNATAVLLSVPEYAYGIPGSFKNALDWTVGAGSLYRKPVTVLSVAPLGRGEHVREALDLVLRALDADTVYRSLPVAPRDRDENGEIRNPAILAELQEVVAELACRSRLGSNAEA